MPRFEAALFYEGKHCPILTTYAEPLGWAPQSTEEHCILKKDDKSEAHLLEDLQFAINFFNQEEVPPLSYRIVRVIFDSVTGYDEITEVEED